MKGPNASTATTLPKTPLLRISLLRTKPHRIGYRRYPLHNLATHSNHYITKPLEELTEDLPAMADNKQPQPGVGQQQQPGIE